MSHVYGMRLVFSNFKSYNDYRSGIMNDIKLSRRCAHSHILNPIGYHVRNLGSIVLIYETSPLVPFASYYDEVSTLHIAGQLASTLAHLHDCGILLNNFDQENFAFDEDKLMILSMQKATRQDKDFDSDVAGFIRFIESIKDANYTAIDPLLAQCRNKYGVTAHFVLDQLRILYETNKSVSSIQKQRGHQRTTSGNSSNESNGTELTSLSYFSDYNRSDVFYMETRHKGLNTYANITN